MFRRRPQARNRRASSSRQREKQHLLGVKVRHHKAAQQRNQAIVLWTVRIVLSVACIAGVTYGVKEGLRRFLWENPDYRISSISVMSSGSLTREEILGATGIAEGVNIFRVSLSEARAKLAEIPQVESAELERILPDRIEIKVTERSPVSWITKDASEDPSTSKHAFLLDAKGVAMSTKRILPEYYHLPVIYGMDTAEFIPGQRVTKTDVRAALELLRLNSDNMRFQITAIDLSRGYCMLVTDRTHAQITFGIDQIDRQLERLNAVFNYLDDSKREVQTVNLLVERNIPVTFAPLPAPEQEGSELAVLPAPVSAAAEKAARKAEPVTKKTSPDSKRTSQAKSNSVKTLKKTNPASNPFLDPEKPVRRAEPVRKALPISTQKTNQHG